MLYALNHLLAVLIAPLPLAAALAGMGGFIKLIGHRRLGSTIMAVACIVGIGSTLGPVANALLYPLENKFPPILSTASLPFPPRYVVVLGSGYSPRSGIPFTAALEAEGIVRLTEGIRLFRQLPESTLVLSGGSISGHPPSAYGYASGALALGVKEQSLILIDTPVNTAAEIHALRDRVGDEPVLLVTSAAHMPRAMAYCKRVGVHAVAAPTGQLAHPVTLMNVSTWLPSGAHLRMTESALHEYVGLLALSLGPN